MEDLLIELLKSFGCPVRRQGSLAANEKYPDRFFTFWNNDSYDGNHYDNKNISIICNFDVNFYSINVDDTYSILREARKLLKSNGFIISGDGYDVASDEETHTGRGMNVLYMKLEEV